MVDATHTPFTSHVGVTLVSWLLPHVGGPHGVPVGHARLPEDDPLDDADGEDVVDVGEPVVTPWSVVVLAPVSAAPPVATSW
jgi:hypothetical protein